MIGQKLILPTTVQAEIDEVALLYAPVPLLRVRSIGNLNLDFKIRISDLQSNAKSENRFQR